MPQDIPFLPITFFQVLELEEKKNGENTQNGGGLIRSRDCRFFPSHTLKVFPLELAR